MSDFFETMFDSDIQQRLDIRTLRLDDELTQSNFGVLQERLVATEARLNRTELVVEALYVYLENQGLVNRETFALLLREVDGLDGKLDGRAMVKPSAGEGDESC